VKSDNSLVLVALDRGRVVGYSFSLINEPSNLEKREKYGYIHDVLITASYRRRGIGEEMLSEILKWFQSRNTDRVELEVLAKNQMAYSFWKKHGFTDYRHRLYRQI